MIRVTITKTEKPTLETPEPQTLTLLEIESEYVYDTDKVVGAVFAHMNKSAAKEAGKLVG